MTWLTWRQFRAQAVTAAAALAAFAILLAVTGPHLAGLYAASGITGCKPASCANLAAGFLAQLSGAGTYPLLDLLGVMVILLAPAIIGLFWGAPLIARELEDGTSALAWNQSITRGRWLAVKLLVVGLAAMAVTEGLSLMLAWWAAPIGRAVGQLGSLHFTLPGEFGFVLSRFSPLAFASQGITPLGYAAFGFVLGVAAGVLIRRTLPATASGKPSATSPPAVTGLSRGPRRRSTSSWPWPWPGTASGRSTAAAPSTRHQAARRRTSQMVAAMSSTDSASSQPPSIHWKGQNRLAGW
jgi:hypothetical protein